MKEEAWECYEEALQCDSLRERKRLLNEAIQFDPDFLDAKSELASLCTNADTRMKKFRELQTEEEAILEREHLMERKGSFYGIWETRPYIRLRYRIFSEFIERRQLRLAMKEGEEILIYNENDNTGSRYALLAIYCLLEEFDKADDLLRRYPEESVPMLLYEAVLNYRRNDRRKMRRNLRKIRERVPEVGRIAEVIEELSVMDDCYLMANSLQEVYYYLSDFPELFAQKDLLKEMDDIWVKGK